MTYDIIIIGCGPAGMTAAIYALRANKKVLILEKETIGGNIASSPLIENYPGFIAISGSEFANNLYDQVINLGGEIELEEVQKIKTGKIKEVVTDEHTYKAKTIIIATGNKYRLLGLTNEDNLIGKGIHFCVACDGSFYKNKTVAVIGGGNSAIINALTLSDMCHEVIVVQNLADLTGEEILADKLKAKKNVKIYYKAKVKEIIGHEELENIIITVNNQDILLKIDGMFISIGQVPQTEFIPKMLLINENQYIVTDIDAKTNLDGIFAAGDVCNKKVRQLTTAVNDGTIAALNAIEYLKK